MRRIFLFIAAFVVGAFAFTNLTFTPATITMGSKTVITGNFSAVGDSADVLIFIDDNANNALDAGELIIYDSKKEGEKFVDGGDDEMDTVADGLVSMSLEAGKDGPFNFAGTYIMIMADNGGPDTAALVVTPGATTNTTVAGTVSGPSGILKNIMVFVAVELGDDHWHTTSRSGTDGTFLIYLPDSMQGKKAWIGAEDEFEVYTSQALIPPAEVETTVVASITGLSFVFQKATQFIKGQVVNETGAAVGDVRLWIEDEDDTDFDVKVDASGNFLAPVKTGSYKIGFDDWGSDDTYMTPEVKVVVGTNDDTVSVVYKLYTTNATISGTVIDSAGINLEDDFGVNVSIDTTGVWDWDKGVWYYANADIDDNGGFSIKVNSKFLRYMLHTWADDLPQGYFVSPSYIDSVGPGQSGIQIFIKKADQLMEVAVVDMSSYRGPVADVTVQLLDQQSSGFAEAVTDSNGIARLNVYPGNWRIWLKETNYMKQDMYQEVKEGEDTVKATFQVLSADASITGTVSGDISAIIDEIEVMASGQDSLNMNYHNYVKIDQSGNFTLSVSSKIAGYHVSVNDWNLPDDYIVTPGGDYSNVAPATTGLTFVITKVKGSISGKFFMTLPNNCQTGIMVIDSTTMWSDVSQMEQDSTFHFAVPNGTYTVIGGYQSATDTLYHIVQNVVVLDNDVVVNFYDSGGVIVPIIHTPIANNLVFNMKCYPNPFRGTANIAFATPVDGKATLRIYDLNGRMLKTLYNGSVSKGNYYVQFTTSDLDYQLGAGYYIARIDIKGKKRYTRNIRLINVK